MTTIVHTQGFRAFLIKELREWWRRRAALTTAVAVSVLGVIGTLATRIDEWAGGVPTSAELGPTANVLGAQFDQWVVLAAIFASLGLVTTERATGTLAWTLSKPISRSAVLIAKWVAGVLVLAVAAVAIPLGVSVAISTVAYGGVADIPTVAAFGLCLVAVAAFIVAFDLALATRLDSQAGIAALALAVFAAPYLIGSIAPSLAAWWPTAITSLAGVIADGSALELATLLGWAGSTVIAIAAAVLIFEREDL